MAQPSVLIGMSGGVDSSVAVQLMLQQGFSCIGCNLQLTCTDDGTGTKDARAVAERFGIPFLTWDLREEFRKIVTDKFTREYESGRTPNPCIDCNRGIKFGAMLDKALELGCDAIVTGHYAKIRRDSHSGRYLLYKANDLSKDQTYFLYALTQHQLAHTLFPLGELTKAEVRKIAEENQLINARKRDSQDICFIPDGDYFSFLEHYTGKRYPGGNFLDTDGNTVGKHRGAVSYTLGQRKGLGIALGAPVYVCGKDMVNNTVTVGPNEKLFSKRLIADNWNWFPFPALEQPMVVGAKIRHSQTEVPATVYPLENGRAAVVFDSPQRAVTPGQAVVLYQQDAVIGGGTILEAFPE